MTKRLFFVLIAVVLAALYGSFSFIRGKELSHDTVKVARETVVHAVYATGTVEPVYWAQLAPYKTGRLMEIVHHEGDKIKKGDVVARMENRMEAQNLAEAQAKLDFANKELERDRILIDQNAISRREFEDAERAQRSLSAQVQSLRRAVEDLTLVSPVDGVVLRRDIELGEVAEAGKTIFWVGKPVPLRITADVDEEDIAEVQLGQKALIKADAFEGKVFEGKVNEITPKGDPINKVFRVRIRLPDDTPLLTGMTTEVNILTKTVDNALVVPVTSEADGYVWRMEGHQPVKTAVKTGVRSESMAEITEGLKEGDLVLRQAPSHKAP